MPRGLANRITSRLSSGVGTWREMKGLEAPHVAKFLGTKTGTIGALEAGSYDPTVTQLCGLATLFGVKPAVLLPSNPPAGASHAEAY